MSFGGAVSRRAALLTAQMLSLPHSHKSPEENRQSTGWRWCVSDSLCWNSRWTPSAGDGVFPHGELQRTLKIPSSLHLDGNIYFLHWKRESSHYKGWFYWLSLIAFVGSALMHTVMTFSKRHSFPLQLHTLYVSSVRVATGVEDALNVKCAVITVQLGKLKKGLF